MKFRLLIFFALLQNFLLAQNIDTLINQSKKQFTPDKYLKIIDFYKYTNPDSAFYFAEKGYKLSISYKFVNYTPLFVEKKGDIYEAINEYYDAISQYYEALKYYNDTVHYYEIGILMRKIAVLITKLDIRKNISNFFAKAEKNFIKIKDTTDLILTEIAFAKYLKNTKPDSAQKLLKKAKSLNSKLQNLTLWAKINEAESDLILTDIDNRQQLTKAIIRLKKAFINLDTNDLYYWHIKEKIANLYYKSYNISAAEISYKEILAYYKRHNIVVKIPPILLILADISKRRENKNAIEMAQEALRISQKYHMRYYIEESYQELSEIYAELNYPDLALSSFKKYAQLKEKRFKENAEKEFLLQNSFYKTLIDLKNKELIAAEKEKLALINKQQKLALIISIILLLVLALVISLQYKIYLLKKRSESRLRQIAEASLEGLFLHDGNKILEVNNKFLELLDYKREEIVGKSIYEIIDEKSHETVRKNLNLNKTTYYYSLFIKRKDGTSFEAEVLSKPFKFNNKNVKVVSIRDTETIKKAVRELELIQLRFKTILDFFPDGILILDKNQNITYASSACINIFDVKSDEFFINKKFWQLFKDEKDIERAQFQIGQIFFKEAPSMSEYTIETSENEKYLEVNGSIFKDNNGEIIGAFLIVRDITIVRRTIDALSETQARFKNLFDEAKDAIIIYNKENNEIVDVNPAACLLLEQDDFDLISKSIYDFINIPKEKLNIEELANSSKPIQIPIKTASGKKLITQASASVVNFSEEKLYMLIIRDITDAVLQQQQLEKFAKELETSNRMKDKMFSIIAHDLRGAIGNLKQIINFIADNPQDFSYDEIIETISSMRRVSNATYDLLENLLNWAKSQQNLIKFQPAEINPAETAQEVIDIYKPIAEEKNITLIFENNTDTKVIADENMLKTIIRNLISNAIKFTNPGGFVKVKIEDRSNNEILISVSDNGLGMSKDVMEKIFDEKTFYTKRGTKNEKGTGLGLKLCKEFVEMHKGKIWIKSTEGEGTTFFFTLKKQNLLPSLSTKKPENQTAEKEI